jgi:hypothetical protein
MAGMFDFDARNYLENIKQIVTGSQLNGSADGGYLRDKDITFQLRGLSTGPIGSTSTVGTNIVSYNTVIPPPGSSIQYGPFQIPRSYDQTSDILQFRLLGSTATAVTELVLASLAIYSPGASTASTTATVGTSFTFPANTFTAFSIPASGYGLAQDDAVYLNLQSSTTSITVFSGAMVWADCTVAWDQYGSEFVGPSTQEIRQG